MKAALFGLLLAGCTASAAPLAYATPPVESVAIRTVLTSVTTSQKVGFRQGNALTLRFTSIGADDIAARLATDIPSAWSTATRGLGSVTVTTSSGITVEVSGAVGISQTAGNDADPLVMIYRTHPNGGSVNYTYSLMHELGHLMGCCRGPNTNASGHFTDAPQGLMTEPRCDCAFTDRELRAMGLL